MVTSVLNGTTKSEPSTSSTSKSTNQSTRQREATYATVRRAERRRAFMAARARSGSRLSGILGSLINRAGTLQGDCGATLGVLRIHVNCFGWRGSSSHLSSSPGFINEAIERPWCSHARATTHLGHHPAESPAQAFRLILLARPCDG